MSYSTKINSNIINIPAEQALDALYYMGLVAQGETLSVSGSTGTVAPYKATYKPGIVGAEDSVYLLNDFTRNGWNIVVKDNTTGAEYNIKNTKGTKEVYNLYDVIAAGTAAGINNQTIADALNKVGVTGPDADRKWTPAGVAGTNRATDANSRRVVDYLNQHGFTNADVVTKLNPNGKGYTYSIRYTDDQGQTQYADIAAPSKDNYSNEELAKIFDEKQPAGQAARYVTGVTVPQQNTNLQNVQIAADNFITTYKDSNVGSTANANRTITPEQYAKLKVALPNYSDQQLNKMITESPWVTELLPALTGEFSDEMTGAKLSEHLGFADVKNKAALDSADAQLAYEQLTRLNNIKNDTSLLTALRDARNADAAAGTIAGARAANAQQVAAEANAKYGEEAAALLEALATLPQTTREELYGNSVEGLKRYVDQQLGEAYYQAGVRNNNINDIATGLDVLRAAQDSQLAQAGRDVNEEISRSSDYLTQTIQRLASETDAAIAADDAELSTMLKNAKGIMDAASYTQLVSDVQSILDKKAESGKNFGTGAVVNPNYVNVDEGKIDETLLRDVLNSPATEHLLSDNTYKYATQNKTRSQLLNDFGVGFLATPEAVYKDYYEDFAESANAEADRTFTQAQRAYLASIAAGDAKTAEQLTKLAQTAGASKRNLHGAAAFAGMFNQQRNNANVGNTMVSNYKLHKAANDKQLATAWDNAQELYNTQKGVDPNVKTFGGVADLYNQGSTVGKKAYGGAYVAGMEGQRNWNDTISAGNRATNNNLANFGSRLQALNTQAATHNTANDATKKQTLYDVSVQGELARQQLEAIANGKTKF
jgi:hypothetical protein